MAISERDTPTPKLETPTAKPSPVKGEESKVESKIPSRPKTNKLSVVEYFNEYGWPPPDEVLAVMRSVGLGRKLRRPPRSTKK